MALPLWASQAIPAVVGGGLSFLGGREANKATARLTQYQAEFQKMMSDTAHQREVADMRAAGLNPILSATGGPGASTPSGSSATMEDVLTPAVSTALAQRMARSELQNQALGRERTRTETERIAAERELTITAHKKAEYERRVLQPLMSELTQAQIDNTTQSSAESRARTANTEGMLPAIEVLGSSAGGVARLLGSLGGPIASLLNLFRGKR